jgi:hypothetical protein
VCLDQAQEAAKKYVENQPEVIFYRLMSRIKKSIPNPFLDNHRRQEMERSNNGQGNSISKRNGRQRINPIKDLKIYREDISKNPLSKKLSIGTLGPSIQSQICPGNEWVSQSCQGPSQPKIQYIPAKYTDGMTVQSMAGLDANRNYPGSESITLDGQSYNPRLVLNSELSIKVADLAPVLGVDAAKKIAEFSLRRGDPGRNLEDPAGDKV